MRYLPVDAAALTPRQRRAIGCVLEVCCLGIAPGPWGGEPLYQEVPGQDIVGPTLIPARDVSFIH